MTRAHRELGRCLLGTTALLVACTPTPSEVETSPGVTTGESTVGPVSSTATMDTATLGTATLGTADDTGPSFDPICGDGLVESPEECDLGDLNHMGMYCTNECRNNICGDGYKGPGEGCDDGNQSNEDLCTNECGLTTCGDGVVQAGEDCDEARDNSETGACLPSCVAASCGDQFIQDGVEVCDSNDIGDQTCKDLGFGGGVLLCADDCLELDTADCYGCGDGSIDPGEDCDGAQLGGATCQDLAMPGDTASGGMPACNACLLVEGTCTFCGDGMREGTEVCDGNQLGGATCMSLGFGPGVLVCTGNCTFNTAGCNTCGNGTIQGAEECDGANLDGGTCATVVGAGSMGNLACNANCTYDASDCCALDDQPCTDDADCCSLSCHPSMDYCQ